MSSTSYKKDIADKLKSLREKQGLSYTAVGEMIGKSRQSYTQYENSVAEPDAETLVKLADLYNVTVDYLLGHEEKKFVEDVAKMSDNSLDKTLLQLFADLPEKSKQGIRDFVKAIANGVEVDEEPQIQKQPKKKDPNEFVVTDEDLELFEKDVLHMQMIASDGDPVTETTKEKAQAIIDAPDVDLDEF